MIDCRMAGEQNVLSLFGPNSHLTTFLIGNFFSAESLGGMGGGTLEIVSLDPSSRIFL